MLSREKMGTGACGNGGRPVRTFGDELLEVQPPPPNTRLHALVFSSRAVAAASLNFGGLQVLSLKKRSGPNLDSPPRREG